MSGEGHLRPSSCHRLQVVRRLTALCAVDREPNGALPPMRRFVCGVPLLYASRQQPDCGVTPCTKMIFWSIFV